MGLKKSLLIAFLAGILGFAGFSKANAVPTSSRSLQIPAPITTTHNISEAFENSFGINSYLGSEKGLGVNGGTYNSTGDGTIFTLGQIGYKELPGKIDDNQNEGTKISVIGGYKNGGFVGFGSTEIWSGHYSLPGSRTTTTPTITDINTFLNETDETQNFFGASLESLIKGRIKLIGQYGQNIDVTKTKTSDFTEHNQIYNDQTTENQSGILVTTLEDFYNNTRVNTSVSSNDWYSNLGVRLGLEGKFKKNLLHAEDFSLWGRLNNQKLKTQNEISQDITQRQEGNVYVIVNDGTNVDTTIVPVSYSGNSSTSNRQDAEWKNSDFSIGGAQTFNIGRTYLDVSLDQTFGSKQKEISANLTAPVCDFSENGHCDGLVGKIGYTYSPQFKEISVSGTQGLNWLRFWSPQIVLESNKKIMEAERTYFKLSNDLQRNVSITEGQEEQLQRNIKNAYLKSIGGTDPSIILGMSVGEKNDDSFVKMNITYSAPKYSISGSFGNPETSIGGTYRFGNINAYTSYTYNNSNCSSTLSAGVTFP